MSTLAVCDSKGASVGNMDVPADWILPGEKGRQALHDVVVAHQAACRQGSASTKEKGEVAGSGRKPWRQKGTGRARAGYRQSPVWRGGGTVFGPKPRDYGKKVNRKVARLALRKAFSEKMEGGQVRVLDRLVLEEAKTKAFAGILKALDIQSSALFVVDKLDSNVALASRNMPRVEVIEARNVHPYQILRYSVVVITKDALTVLGQRFGDAATEDAS